MIGDTLSADMATKHRGWKAVPKVESQALIQPILATKRVLRFLKHLGPPFRSHFRCARSSRRGYLNLAR